MELKTTDQSKKEAFMDKKVYIIFEQDLANNRKNVYRCFADKTKAKTEVDKLVNENIDNDDLDYTLESFELL